MVRRSLLAAALCALAALPFGTAPASAHEFQAGSITVGHPWGRPTAAGQSNGSAYFKLVNKGDAADRLVGVSGTVASSIQMHSMSMDGNVMRMRQVDAIDVPAHGTVELKPGGLHIMLLGLKAPLKSGEKVPLKLKFERAGEVAVEVLVQDQPGAAASAPAAAPMAHGEHQHQH